MRLTIEILLIVLAYLIGARVGFVCGWNDAKYDQRNKK